MKNKFKSIVTGVEDRGYGTKIRLRADRQGVGSVYANGWWSPDSTTCGW